MNVAPGIRTREGSSLQGFEQGVETNTVVNTTSPHAQQKLKVNNCVLRENSLSATLSMSTTTHTHY